MNPYHYVTTGPPGKPSYEIIWKANLAAPIATCNSVRDARRICDALNAQELHHEDSKSTKEGDWNRVEDRMPDDDILVLVYVSEIDQLVMAAHTGEGWYADDSILIKTGITHWCDPAPPTLKK